MWASMVGLTFARDVNVRVRKDICPPTKHPVTMPPPNSIRRATAWTRSLTAAVPTAGIALSAALAASVASAQSIPSGGRPSPRYGAEPFTQKLLLAEEFGTRPIPANGELPEGAVVEIGCGNDVASCPSPVAIDSALAAFPAPAPTRECNPLPQNPNKPLIEQLLGRPVPYAPADGRPPGLGWAHQRFEEFPPQVFFKSAQ
ncbi:MAG: hypothetical protein RL277_98, partial [Planctomycetota bacterium]